MLLFPLLQVLLPSLRPEEVKLHLATWNGTDDPLDVYVAGDFDAWQAHQTKPNFSRPNVVALIGLPERSQWLFAGVFAVAGRPNALPKGGYRYSMREEDATKELSGRLVVTFERPGRQSYLNAGRWLQSLTVSSIRPERYQIAEFAGYTKVHVSFETLKAIVRQQQPSWKSALSAVGGVYVIADAATGKLYVGSATGMGGFWGRWLEYAATGHGGNVRLRELGKAPGEPLGGLHFSILETADTRTSQAEIEAREQFWKTVLLTRMHGLNAN